MRTSNFLKVTFLVLPLMFGACKSKQPTTENEVKAVQPIQEKNFLEKVTNNAQTTSYITSKVKLSVEYGVQSITLTGNLHMKRDDVIRLQLMAFGFVEAARVEFTNEYMLIMDRINKQYLKAPYAHIDFLRNSGLNFYSIQALFWNELFQPNRSKLLEEDYGKFKTNTGGSEIIIKLEDGKMDYSWLADNNTGFIKMANILYKDKFNGNSQLNWDYEGFKLLDDGKKQFPTDMQVTLNTGGKEVKLGVKLNYIKHETEWETRTKVSNKYREVTADEILRRFMAL